VENDLRLHGLNAEHSGGEAVAAVAVE